MIERNIRTHYSHILTGDEITSCNAIDVKLKVPCHESYLLDRERMEEQTFDSSKLHDFLKKNLVDFPKGDGELKIFKFR